MIQRTHVVFLFNLLQDVNILRPLAFLAGNGLRLDIDFLLSRRFLARDASGAWRKELEEIADHLGARTHVYNDEADAILLLDGRGAIFAGSESDLSAHSGTHDIFRIAPPSYRTIALQHGLECVGFLHNRNHDRAHGRHVGFGADMLCGWLPQERLVSLLPRERSKLVVTGPSTVLQKPRARERLSRGLVCENLHSVRLNSASSVKTDFLTVFDTFCRRLESSKQSVTLRPHPGGQYVLKHNTPLRDNVLINDNPMYKVDLSSYSYGISAPSSVLIDMVLAGIPTAVWRDADDTVDARNYEGLARVGTPDDWIAFAQAAEADPAPFIERQRHYLASLEMPTDPQDVGRRFMNVLQAAIRPDSVATESERRKSFDRILFVAPDNLLPTLQISLLRPLAHSNRERQIRIDRLSEQDVEREGRKGGEAGEALIRRTLDDFDPTLIVFCRYGGPHGDLFLSHAAEHGITTVYHLDDDLLDVPASLGEKKLAYHGNPNRVSAIRNLLERVDLVYFSNERLARKMRDEGLTHHSIAGTINLDGRIRAPASERPVRTMGYTGFIEKSIELAAVAPAVARFLDGSPDRRFEVIGSLVVPPSLESYAPQIEVFEAIRDYDAFLDFIAERQWDIGICPLAQTAFNHVKSNNKWVEFTSAGAAVIASAGTVYDECCADGCGVLVESVEEWRLAIDALAQDPKARFEIARRAQDRLTKDYTLEGLRDQVLDVFRQAHEQRALKSTFGHA